MTMTAVLIQERMSQTKNIYYLAAHFLIVNSRNSHRSLPYTDKLAFKYIREVFNFHRSKLSYSFNNTLSQTVHNTGPKRQGAGNLRNLLAGNS